MCSLKWYSSRYRNWTPLAKYFPEFSYCRKTSRFCFASAIVWRKWKCPFLIEMPRHTTKPMKPNATNIKEKPLKSRNRGTKKESRRSSIPTSTSRNALFFFCFASCDFWCRRKDAVATVCENSTLDTSLSCRKMGYWLSNDCVSGLNATV